MNTMLLELIAAHASASGNPGVSEMMARMRATSGDGACLDPSELLAQMGNGNPLLNIFMKQMAEKKEADSARQLSPVIDMEPLEENPELSDEAARESEGISDAMLGKLQQQVDSMSAEMNLLRERNDLLAAAVGACCLCWGQDLGCRSCRGRGGPGFSIPDESLFGEYVVPAIETLRAQKLKFRKSSLGLQLKGSGEEQLRDAANH